MLRNLLIALLVGTVSMLGVQGGFAGEFDVTGKQIRKLESAMLEAHTMLDFSTLSNIYADDYIYISDDGTQFTKNQVVEMVKKAAVRVDSIPVSNSRIRVYGSVAIVTGVRKFYRLGKILTTARYTEVWLNRNKRWQCASGQLTSIPEKK